MDNDAPPTKAEIEEIKQLFLRERGYAINSYGARRQYALLKRIRKEKQHATKERAS